MWLLKIYKKIFKISLGDKKSFTAALTLRLMTEAPKMKKLPEAEIKKGMELLYGKFTGKEVITADELKAYFEDMMKKMPKKN